MSRRRPARRPARARATRRRTLPDWAWGAAIGVFVLTVIGGFLLVRNVGSGGGSTCDRELPPLGNSEISEQAFHDEDSSLGRILDLLNQGNLADAESAFYGPVHNFTHNVDPPVRKQDEQVAKNLCRAVLELEDSLAFDTNTVNIAFDLQRVRNLLRDAAQALGYARPQ